MKDNKKKLKKKVLIIGSGGREHALGWKLKQSPHVEKIFFAPGNGGTQEIGKNVNIPVEDVSGLLQWVKKNRIDLTVVGPEVSLSLGIVDEFEKHNILIFGPTKKAARLESDKAWTGEFLKRNNIPHPASYIFSEHRKAKLFITSHPASKIVIKASGLAAGKGVLLPTSKHEAYEMIDRIMIKKEFGDAGKQIVIQERLLGPEVSLLAFTDGKTIIPLPPTQDHKRIFDNDKGENTGGMGAYAPVAFVSPQLLKTIEKDILKPTIDGMRKEGIIYMGVLYAGLMITNQGPKVLEFNARFGDPETQPLMMLLKTDLFKIFLACIQGDLDKLSIAYKKGAAVCVVVSSGGYPGPFKRGLPISGLNIRRRSDVEIFHAGTAVKQNTIVTNGGRVLGIAAFEKTLKTALKNAYNLIHKKKVFFQGMHYRTDIGRLAITSSDKTKTCK